MTQIPNALKPFPKFTDFLENPLDKHGHMSAPQFKALSYFKAVEAWRKESIAELNKMLEETKIKEFGVGDWPYESGRNKGIQETLETVIKCFADREITSFVTEPITGEKVKR